MEFSDDKALRIDFPYAKSVFFARWSDERLLDRMSCFQLQERIPQAVVPNRKTGQKDRIVKEKVTTMKNVFDAILETGHDEDFVPVVTDDFRPTDAPAGSPAKLEVLAERVRKGLPLWHPEDRVDYAGLTGAVRPRD